MEVSFIVTDSETLKDTSSNTLQNQSLHTLPEVPLDRSMLENISSPPNLQLSDYPARSDLISNLDCTVEYKRVNISDEESILNNGWELLQVADDHNQSNIDMYNSNDCTIGKQLTKTLTELHIAYYELK